MKMRGFAVSAIREVKCEAVFLRRLSPPEQPFRRFLQHVRVVESERRERGEREPGGFIGVAARGGSVFRTVDNRPVDDAHDTAARVAAGPAERAELRQIARDDARFFEKLGRLSEIYGVSGRFCVNR